MIPRPVPPLEAEGLLLTALSDADADAVVALSDDPETRAWSSLKTVRSAADAEGWIRERLARLDGMTWAVRDADSGELVARVGLIRINEADRVAEMGYSVRADRRRSGIATRAVRAVASYGFAELGLARIILQHATGNRASCAVARATGFAYEGTARALFDHGDGVRYDYHIHARLADDPAGPVATPAPQPIEPTELAAGRLVLRPPSPGLAPELLAMGADPELARWNRVGATDEQTALAWLAHAADWSSGEYATFAILDATSGRFLGNTSLFHIDRTMHDAEIGYRVAAWARGQGVATQAVRAVTAWAYDTLDLHRMCLYHAVDNAASCRVAEKSGYRLEGTLRSSYVYGDGERHDEHLHGRLATDPAPA
jgi:RimJ/RimL family protein N-acetyltransferase